MECADAPDVCKAEQNDDLSNVEFRAEALSGNTVAVQAGVQHGQDGRRRQGADKRDAGGTEQSVSAKCQVSDDCVGNLCGSRVTCRDKMTPSSVHLNGHTLYVRRRFRVEIEGRQRVRHCQPTHRGSSGRRTGSTRSFPVEGEGSAGKRGALTRSMVTGVRDLLVVKRGRAQSACVIATGRVAT